MENERKIMVLLKGKSYRVNEKNKTGITLPRLLIYVRKTIKVIVMNNSIKTLDSEEIKEQLIEILNILEGVTK